MHDVDSLMAELCKCDLLGDLFLKYSSQACVLTIHIMQDFFIKSSRKHASHYSSGTHMFKSSSKIQWATLL